MMTCEEMIEHLYDLDRKELRRLAYEALLISDGPDHISGEVEHAAIRVSPLLQSPPGFLIHPVPGQR